MYTLYSFMFASIAVMIANMNVGFFSDLNLPWFYKGGMIATFIMCLGGLFFKYEKIINRTNRLFFISFLFIYFIVAHNYVNTGDVSINVASVSYIGFIATILGIFSLVMICKLIPSNKYTQFVGRNTLGLYFLSGALPNIMAIFMGRFIKNYDWISYISVSILSFAISLPIIYFMNKFVPFVFDLRKLSI